jgi:TonB family protein
MRQLAAIAVVALLPALSATAQPTKEFRLIQHWDREAGARTSTAHDTLQLRKGTVRTRTVHTDFVLRFDYRLLRRGRGGALLVRAGLEDGRLRAYRVALDDGPARGSLTGVERTLGDVTHDRPATGPAADGWIACEVRVLGETLSVAIDSTPIGDAKAITRRPGYIAFEAGGGGLDLRGMRIAPLGVDAGEFAAGVVSPKTPNVMPPTMASRADPVYPRSLRHAGVTGMVILDVVVQADGRPGEMRVVDAPHPDFALAAIDCVRQWRFKPATKAGEPVPMLVTVEVVFKLARTR